MIAIQRVALGVLLTITLAVQPAIAADKKDKAANEAQKRVAMIKQQLEAEKTELQASFDKEKAELQGKAEQIEKAGSTFKRHNAELTQELDVLRKELEVLRKDKTELEAAKLGTESTLADAQRDLRSNDEQRKELSKLLLQRDQGLAFCNEKNARLHDFGLDLVKIYERPSLYKEVIRSEPFTQIKRVELENILQGYRDKLDEQRVSTVTR